MASIRSCLKLCVALLLLSPAAAATSLLADAGFEDGSLGAMSDANSAWEVQRDGASTAGFLIDRIAGTGPRAPRAGSRCCLMSLPLGAVPSAFDHVTIGQRLTLQANVIYEASAWVKWVNTDNGNDSAIISFWARHQADKTFAGKDVWLRNGDWKQLTYRFLAVRPEQPVFVYLSLLPHQIPRRTDILVDEFTLTAVETVTPQALTPGELLTDGGFEAQTVGQAPSGAWALHRGGPGLSATVQDQGGSKVVRLGIPADTDNFTEVRLEQYVTLRKGAQYDISCRMRWNNFPGGGKTGIANWMLYHAGSDTWYGPIDHVLRHSDWHDVPFIHGAPYSGSYKLYVQVFGWGNFGQAMDLSYDDFTVKPRPATAAERSIRMTAPAGLLWDLRVQGGGAAPPSGTLFAGLDPRQAHVLAPVPAGGG